MEKKRNKSKLKIKKNLSKLNLTYFINFKMCIFFYILTAHIRNMSYNKWHLKTAVGHIFSLISQIGMHLKLIAPLI